MYVIACTCHTPGLKHIIHQNMLSQLKLICFVVFAIYFVLYFVHFYLFVIFRVTSDCDVVHMLLSASWRSHSSLKHVPVPRYRLQHHTPSSAPSVPSGKLLQLSFFDIRQISVPHKSPSSSKDGNGLSNSFVKSPNGEGTYFFNRVTWKWLTILDMLTSRKWGPEFLKSISIAFDLNNPIGVDTYANKDAFSVIRTWLKALLRSIRE